MLGKQRANGGKAIGEHRLGQRGAAEANGFLGSDDELQRAEVPPGRRQMGKDIARRLAAAETKPIGAACAVEGVLGQLLECLPPVGESGNLGKKAQSRRRRAVPGDRPLVAIQRPRIPSGAGERRLPCRRKR
jgi:hypothetical protein